MDTYHSKYKKLTGSNYKEVRSKVNNIYRDIKARSKRNPYVRSAYFSRRKIFFDYFWVHLAQKHHRQRITRLKYFYASIDLIKNSMNKPQMMYQPDNTFYRFKGKTKDGSCFYVQIKEDRRTKRKYFMSCFPEK